MSFPCSEYKPQFTEPSDTIKYIQDLMSNIAKKNVCKNLCADTYDSCIPYCQGDKHCVERCYEQQVNCTSRCPIPEDTCYSCIAKSGIDDREIVSCVQDVDWSEPFEEISEKLTNSYIIGVVLFSYCAFGIAVVLFYHSYKTWKNRVNKIYIKKKKINNNNKK